MTKNQASKILDQMTDPEFQVFFTSLPAHVQLLTRGGLGSLDNLAAWYIKKLEPEPPFDIANIPF